MHVHVCLYMLIPISKGTKNVDKQMRKITEGRVRDRGVTWFPELVDKSEYIVLLDIPKYIIHY